MCIENYRASLPVDELLHELGRLFRAKRKADYLICRYLADLADGLESWPGLLIAYGDVYGLARHKLGLSQRAARERVRVGRALRELPAIEVALVSGELPYSRVREITRVATPNDESVWLNAARVSSIRNLEKRVRRSAMSTHGGRAENRNGGRAGRGSLSDEVSLRLPRRIWEVLHTAIQEVRERSDARISDEDAVLSVARMALEMLQVRSAGRPTSAEPNGAVDVSPTVDAPSGTADDAIRKVPIAGMVEPNAVGAADESRDPVPWWHDSARPGPASVASDFDGNLNSATHSGSPATGVRARRVSSQGIPGSPAHAWPADGRTASVPAAVDATGFYIPDGLSANARRIFELIKSGGCWNAATLCEHTALSPAVIAYALTDLELAGCVRRDSVGTLLPLAPRDELKQAG